MAYRIVEAGEVAMKKTISCRLFPIVVLALLCSVPVFSQEQDEDVRGAFLTTRPKQTVQSSKTSTPAKPSRRRPKTQVVKNTNPDTVKTSGTQETGETTPTTTTKTTAPRIGLGLTLFMRDSNGLAVRVDPTHEFRKGDRVRLLLETNSDGYLYIFNTTNNGAPVMIYPNPELDDAGNFIQSHVPVELPSSMAAEERFRWLAFDENAGAEKLYFVFTREPLNKVPIEDELISFCKTKEAICPLRPSDDLWATVRKELNSPVMVAKAQSFGGAQTSSEHNATTRGIGLSKEDPEPSVVLLKASSTTGMLVTALDLIHK
jgi:hypothetical protein